MLRREQSRAQECQVPRTFWRVSSLRWMLEGGKRDYIFSADFSLLLVSSSGSSSAERDSDSDSFSSTGGGAVGSAAGAAVAALTGFGDVFVLDDFGEVLLVEFGGDGIVADFTSESESSMTTFRFFFAGDRKST